MYRLVVLHASVCIKKYRLMPNDYVFKAFKDANEYYSSSIKLMINEVTSVWSSLTGEYHAYYLLIENLKLRGAKWMVSDCSFIFLTKTC
jgi:hypothetical protein